jgi:transposase
MPTAHQQYADWTPQRLIRWAASSGVATAQVVETILASRVHPQQGFRACVGLMRLGKSSSAERLEAACRRALTIGACSYKRMESILKHGLDRSPLPEPPASPAGLQHSNIRGPAYYHQSQGDSTC